MRKYLALLPLIVIGSLAIALFPFFMGGCAARMHPGAANSFDSTTYDQLLVTHSVIETTKQELSVSAFPANVAPNVKTALNDLIKGYDIEQAAYTAYHSAATTGVVTQEQVNAVVAAVKDVNAKTAVLTSAKGTK